MMPRIQFNGGVGSDSGVPGQSVIRETFCDPNSTCSPVVCCCGLITLRTAVRSVVWIALLFSVWEIVMGSWLVIESTCCIEPLGEIEEDPNGDKNNLNITKIHKLGLRQISKLKAAGWLIIFVALFRLTGLIYLLYSVSSEERARHVPTVVCITISILIALILMYPFFIKIPGGGISLSPHSHLTSFKTVYGTGHLTDLVILVFYSSYTVIYYVIVTNGVEGRREEEGSWNSDTTERRGRLHFDPIPTHVNLT